ncbi:MAG: metallophosphoesterase [Haloarculaceae archaeon]
MFDESPTSPIRPPERDGVAPIADDAAEPPTIVSISDIHGHLGEARSALLTLDDHPDYDPVVTTDPAMRLQWADNDYVLVFNGDLTDRGPRNDGVVEMVARLMRQAPDGRVRVTFGNHEMGMLMPDRFGWDGWYSVDLSNQQRRGFLDRIIDGHIVAAYDGYRVTYAHAGRPDPYKTGELNKKLVSVAKTVKQVVGTADDPTVQREVIDGYPEILGLSGRTGRGADAGIAWLDFEYMPEDAPPQVVGHTRQDNPRRRGAVVCQNVIRNNRRTDGGEAVVVETPERLVALGRDGDGDVRDHEFSLPETTEQTV